SGMKLKPALKSIHWKLLLTETYSMDMDGGPRLKNRSGAQRPSFIYKPNNSRSRFVCARLTGISVCFLSSMRSWYELLNQGTTSRMRLMFTRNDRCARQKRFESSESSNSSKVRQFDCPSNPFAPAVTTLIT